MIQKRYFSLIEVLVGISMLASVGGVLGWKMAPLFKEKKYKSDLARLKQACLALQRIALNTQSDWQLVLKQGNDLWTVEEHNMLGLKAPFHVKPLYIADILLDGEKISELKIEFFASGKVLPEGTLSIEQKENPTREEWALSKMFHQETGNEVSFLTSDRSASSQ